MKMWRRFAQLGPCAICEEAIERSDPVREIALLGYEGTKLVHAKCFDEDWEFIEAGLEPFPPPFRESDH